MTQEYPDRENTLAMLGDWKKHHDDVEKLMNGIEASIGLDIDGPMFETVWKLFDAYTNTLAVEVGDSGGWLEWYHAECEMGASKKKAGYDGQLIAIESLGDLFLLIEMSRQRAEA